MRPRICVSIPVRTTESALALMNRLDDDVDLLELRLDYTGGETDLQRLRSATDLPLIATVRKAAEGGLWRGTERERIELLSSSIVAGMPYIDVELSTGSERLLEKAKAHGTGVIASRHYNYCVPNLDEMESLLEEAKKAGASILKIVGTADNYPDNLTCLDFLKANPGNICFAMGPHGVPSRVLSPLVGGAFTYASASDHEIVAPGQLTARQMREVYSLMGVPS